MHENVCLFLAHDVTVSLALCVPKIDMCPPLQAHMAYGCTGISFARGSSDMPRARREKERSL